MASTVSQAEVSPSASSSPAPTDPPTHGANSSNLYLVTFLATLFLLLFVSCAIILRSFILRRRFQRRLDEAMAAGILLAPRAQGSRKKRFGAKPKFYEAYLADGGDNWHQMRPLAAQPILVKRKYREGSTRALAAANAALSPDNAPSDQAAAFAQNAASAVTPTQPVLSPRPCQTAGTFSARRITHSLLRHIPGVHDRLHLNDPETPPPPAPAIPTRFRTEMLQVAVLIAMPSPRKADDSAHECEKSTEEGEEEEELPEVVIGINRWSHYKPPPAMCNEPSTEEEVRTERERAFSRRIAGSL